MKVYTILAKTQIDGIEDGKGTWEDTDVLATASTKDKAHEMIRKCVDYVVKDSPKTVVVENAKGGWYFRIKCKDGDRSYKCDIFSVETELDEFVFYEEEA